MAGKKKTQKVRDYFMVAIIKGATKAAIHRDRKKHTNKRKCRVKVKETEE